MLKIKVMRKLFKILIFFALFGVGAVHAETQTDQVRDFLNTTGQKIIETIGSDDVDAKFETLDEIFEKHVNVKYMARFALGRYYRMMDQKQKEQYQDLFNRYVKSLYKSYPLEFKPEDIQFEILSIVQNNKSIRADVSVTLPPELQTQTLQTVRVSFQMEPKPTGGFWINDLQIAEASMLVTLQSRFLSMMKDDEEEIEWFLDDLNTLVTSNEEQIGINPQ